MRDWGLGRLESKARFTGRILLLLGARTLSRHDSANEVAVVAWRHVVSRQRMLWLAEHLNIVTGSQRESRDDGPACQSSTTRPDPVSDQQHGVLGAGRWQLTAAVQTATVLCNVGRQRPETPSLCTGCGWP